MLQPCATTDPMLLQSQVLAKTRDSEKWEEISFGDVNSSRLGRVGGIWAAGARGLLIEEDTHFPSLHFLTLLQVPSASNQASVSATLEWQEMLEAAEALLALKNSSQTRHQPCGVPGMCGYLADRKL